MDSRPHAPRISMSVKVAIAFGMVYTLWGSTFLAIGIAVRHMPPLMMGATFCSPELIQTLLNAGARINGTDVRGMTPLMFAVSSEEQNPLVARLLMKAGAEVNVKSKAGETAFDWAKKFGNPRTLIPR